MQKNNALSILFILSYPDVYVKKNKIHHSHLSDNIGYDMGIFWRDVQNTWMTILGLFITFHSIDMLYRF